MRMNAGANVYSWGRITVPTHCPVYNSDHVNMCSHAGYEQNTQIPQATPGYS